MKNKVAIVVAHADDEVLGCGGTIAKHIEAGDQVDIVIMADGESSRHTNQNSELIARKASVRRAASILGLAPDCIHYLDLPDNCMDSLPLLHIVQKLEKILRNVAPTTVYTHHSGDLNVDHRLTSQAVLTACRPQPGAIVSRILAFEVLSSTEWQEPTFTPFTPQVFSDITSFFDLKMSALSQYSKEMRPSPHSRSFENVAALSNYRGHSVGVGKAEAFMLLREII